MSKEEAVCQCQCGGIACASRPGRQSGHAGVTVHGIARGYGIGCRCEDCTAANLRKTLASRSSLNNLTRDNATKWGQTWTSAELEVATRSDLTAREAAVLLGRTMLAVANVRGKCQHDPKFIALLGAPIVEEES